MRTPLPGMLDSARCAGGDTGQAGVASGRLAFRAVVSQRAAIRFLHAGHFIVVVVGDHLEHVLGARRETGPVSGAGDAQVRVDTDVVLARTVFVTVVGNPVVVLSW